TVDANSIVKPDGTPTGHGLDTGPIYPASAWGDIIPPFDYTNSNGGTGHYPGLNYSGNGSAIWVGGCAVDLTEPPEGGGPTTTTTSTTTTTTTTTTLPPTTPSPTTVTTVPSTAAPTTPTTVPAT